MSRAFFHHHTHTRICTPSLLPTSHPISSTRIQPTTIRRPSAPLRLNRRSPRFAAVTASLSPLDLTEDNIRQVLTDARVEASRDHRHFDLFLSPRASAWSEIHICAFFFSSDSQLAQIFDDSVGITGKVELAELDGPFVKISLRGRFWHERSTVLARIANYLKQRIPVS